MPSRFPARAVDARSPLPYEAYESWDILAATFLGTCFSKIRGFNHEFKTNRGNLSFIEALWQPFTRTKQLKRFLSLSSQVLQSTNEAPA